MVESRQVEILLVDDSGHDCESLRASFDQTGLSNVVHVACSGDEALDCLRGDGIDGGGRIEPSLILLDMNSQADGQPAVTAELELLSELKSDPDLRSIPVIVVTASSDEADILNTYTSGACSFVSKPTCLERRRKLFAQLAEYWAHVAQLPRTGSNSDEALVSLWEAAHENDDIRPIPVLVVDDSEDDALLLKEAFVDCPLVEFVAFVEDGESALRYLRREAPYVDSRRPALVLLDINMPRMNGFEVLAEMRADEGLMRTPVIMLTTSKQESDILRAYSDGACSFISKPVNFDRMRQIAQRFALYWAVVANTPQVDTAVANWCEPVD
ncbi:response regulator [bacterium]|nr:response regulator [bacterium]